MFEIIIILLMKNKYLMFLSPPNTNIYILQREREGTRTNQDGAMIVSHYCLDNYLAPLVLKCL